MKYIVYGKTAVVLATNEQDEVAEFIREHSNPKILTVVSGGYAIAGHRWILWYETGK